MSTQLRADTEDMATAAIEPISPELVLVCPELREQALQQLDEAAFRSYVSRGEAELEPALEPPQTLRGVVGAGVLGLLQFATLVIVALFAGGAVTLALTIVADATAAR